MGEHNIKITNKILFVCPENKIAIGGEKQIYRMAEVLAESGYQSFVLHENKGFKLNWFDSKACCLYSKSFFYLLRISQSSKIRSKFKIKLKFILNLFKDKIAKNVMINENDILVFPEIYLGYINALQLKNKIVIFNQNCYYTFLTLNNTNYKINNHIANITVSNDSQDYLNLFNNEVKNYRIRLGINSSIFSLNENKKKQICYMPRKLNEDVIQVINLLKIRNVCKDWAFIPIDNMCENEVAETMKTSSIFLSFNYKEGFGLPPVEAMSCGCVIVGYSGNGGNEYFNLPYTFKIEDRNIKEFVLKVEDVVSNIDNQTFDMNKLSKEISNNIIETYNLKIEKEDINNVWKNIFKSI